jgi:hypothetical protein
MRDLDQSSDSEVRQRKKSSNSSSEDETDLVPLKVKEGNLEG